MIPAILANTYVRRQLNTRITNEIPGDVANILPTEGAVTVGRSFWAAKRTGVLEFLERVLDEVFTAAVWLYGVKVMATWMDKGIESLQKRGYLRSVCSTVDWSREFTGLFINKKQAPSIFLSPLERFGSSYAGILKTLAVKGVKWGTAVSVPIYLCGHVIPTLLQRNSQWLMKRFPQLAQRPKQSADPIYPPVETEMAFPVSSFPQYPVNTRPSQPMKQPVSPPSTNAWSASAIYPQAYFPPFAGTNRTTGVPRFGSIPASLPRAASVAFSSSALTMTPLGLLSQLAHYVDNTLYGRILVVDVGLDVNRTTTAFQRSPYESLEIAFRDGASLICYLAVIPKIMTLGAQFLNSALGLALAQHLPGKGYGDIIKLDDQILKNVNQTLTKALSDQPITSESLQKALYGPTRLLPMFDKARPNLAFHLRRANLESFTSLLEKEIQAFSTSQSDTKVLSKLAKEAKTYFQARANKGDYIAPEDLEDFLKALWHGEKAPGALKGLTNAQKYYLSTASKLAFHHEVGITGDSLIRLVQRTLPSDFPEAELAPLLKRLTHAAARGGDQALASMLRRSLNAVALIPSTSHEMLKQVENLVAAVERAVLSGVSVDSVVSQNLQQVTEEYQAFLEGQRKPLPANAVRKELDGLSRQISRALREDLPVPRETLARFATLLRQNGRTFPNGLRWLQGPGLGHLADRVDVVSSLVDGKTPLSKLMTTHVQELMQRLVTAAQDSPRQGTLLQTYQRRIQAILAGEGRASLMLARSLPNFPEQLDASLNRLLLGGLKREDRLYNAALRLLKRIPEDAQTFVNKQHASEMKGLVDTYLSLIEKKLALALKQRPSLTSQELLSNLLTPLIEHNAQWRRGIWIVGFLTSALGVSILIPKLQYWITKALTGKDEHPGLAAVSKGLSRNQIQL